MKTLYVVALGIMLLAMPSISRADKTFTISGLNWNGSMDNPDCTSVGEDCAISLTVVGISVSQDRQGNWRISGGLDQPLLYVQSEGIIGGQVAGYVFQRVPYSRSWRVSTRVFLQCL